MKNIKEYTENWYTDIERTMSKLQFKTRFGGYEIESVNNGVRKLIQTYNDNISNITAAYTALEMERRSLAERLQNAPADSGPGNAKLAEENKNLTIANQQLMKQVEDQKTQINALSGQMKAQASKADLLRTSIDGLNQEKQLRSEEVLHLRRQVEQLTARNSQLENQPAAVGTMSAADQAELENLRSEKAKQTSVIRQLTAQIAENTANAQNLEAQIRKQAKLRTEECAMLNDELKAAEAKANMVEKLYQDANEEIEALHTQISKLRSAAQSQDMTNIGAVAQEIRRLRKERENIREEAAETKKKLELAEVEISVLRDQLEEHESSAALDNQIVFDTTALEQKLAAVEQERDALKERVAALEKEIQNARNDAEDLNEIYREAKRKRREILQEAEAAVNKMMEETRQRTEADSRNAKETIEQDLSEAKKQCQEMLADAQNKADALMKEAQSKHDETEEAAAARMRDAEAAAERVKADAAEAAQNMQDAAAAFAQSLKTQAETEADELVARANQDAAEIEAQADALLEKAKADAEEMLAQAKADNNARLAEFEEEMQQSREQGQKELDDINEKIQNKRDQHTALLRQISDVRLNMLDSLQSDINRLNQLSHEISRNNVLTSSDMNFFTVTGNIRPMTISSAPQEPVKAEQDEEKKETEELT